MKERNQCLFKSTSLLAQAAAISLRIFHKESLFLFIDLKQSLGKRPQTQAWTQLERADIGREKPTGLEEAFLDGCKVLVKEVTSLSETTFPTCRSASPDKNQRN